MRAHFHAKARRRVYGELPKEDCEEEMCGLMRNAMYGTRDAAQNWEVEHIEMMIEAGFTQGVYSPCVFYHKNSDTRPVAHGYDFAVLGKVGALDWTG